MSEDFPTPEVVVHPMRTRAAADSGHIAAMGSVEPGAGLPGELDSATEAPVTWSKDSRVMTDGSLTPKARTALKGVGYTDEEIDSGINLARLVDSEMGDAAFGDLTAASAAEESPKIVMNLGRKSRDSIDEVAPTITPEAEDPAISINMGRKVTAEEKPAVESSLEAPLATPATTENLEDFLGKVLSGEPFYSSVAGKDIRVEARVTTDGKTRYFASDGSNTRLIGTEDRVRQFFGSKIASGEASYTF